MPSDLFGELPDGPVSDCAFPTLGPQNGTAAQFLVLSRLLQWGLPALWVDSTVLPYDLAILEGPKACRVQVKSCKAPTATGKYHFITSRGKWARNDGQSGLKLYELGDYDIIAYVALGIREMLFQYGVCREPTMIWTLPQFNVHGADHQTWQAAFSQWQSTCSPSGKP